MSTEALLEQILAEQKRQGELLDHLMRLATSPAELTPEQLDAMMRKGMELAQQRSAEVGVLQRGVDQKPTPTS